VDADPTSHQVYVRPPGRDVPGITRANRDEPETATQASAPVFSNEGKIRQAEVRRRSRILGPVAGVLGALSIAGIALGRGLGSHLPGAKTAATRSSLSPLEAGSADFDRSGTPRVSGGRRRRTVGAMLLAGLLGVVVLGFGPAAILPLLASNTAPSRSPGAQSNVALGDASTQPVGSSAPIASAAPSGVVVGDNSLTPDAMTPSTAVLGTTGTPRPTPKLTAAPTLPPTSAPAPTRTPAATPTATSAPTPTRTPAATPTATPAATPAVNFVTFEPTGTYSVLRGTNFTFIIDGLGGARCTLSSNPHRSGAPMPTTVPGTAPQVNTITLSSWGMNWPVGPYTVTATCTLTGYPTATATKAVSVN
jgi:hypothetical protein